MDVDENALRALIAKDEIRDLALLWSRASDRRDLALLRSLYTRDGTNRSEYFSGTADDMIAFMEANFSALGYTGHHVCNHLIAIDGENNAHGEVYGIAYLVLLGDEETVVEQVLALRYLDHYRREDGRWRFASRSLLLEYESQRSIPAPEGEVPPLGSDPSYSILPAPLFALGARSNIATATLVAGAASSTGSANDALATLVIKDEIRQLVHLYSRAADRRDGPLMRSLYTRDGYDHHGDMFSGTADEFVAFMGSVSYVGYAGHHICNHLIAVDSENEAHGEVYCIAFHVIFGENEATVDHTMIVRSVDHYRKEEGRWRFATRHCIFDYDVQRPIARPAPVYPEKDQSYEILPGDLFQRGARL